MLLAGALVHQGDNGAHGADDHAGGPQEAHLRTACHHQDGDNKNGDRLGLTQRGLILLSLRRHHGLGARHRRFEAQGPGHAFTLPERS